VQRGEDSDGTARPTATALPMESELHADAPQLRLVVVGDSGTGKSALFERFLHGRFVGQSAPTISVDVATAKVSLGAQRVGVQLYDTAGQERFAPLTAPYYRQAEGILVTFDIGQRSSFERAVTYWGQEIQRHASTDVAVLLVGTKADLSLDAPRSRQVDAGEAAAAAAQRGWLYFAETSALTGAGVGDAFYLLSCAVMNSRLEADGQKVAEGVALHKAPPPGTRKGCAC